MTILAKSVVGRSDYATYQQSLGLGMPSQTLSSLQLRARDYTVTAAREVE